ncbi:MAG: nitric oxide-sensing protein NosP, partial [Glaciecola sp.]
LDPHIACLDIKTQLDLTKMSTIIFYCSSAYDLDVLATNINEHFPDHECVGCTTAGEFAGNGYETNSMVALGYHDSHFVIQSTLVENLQSFTVIDAQNVMNTLKDAIALKAIAPLERQSFLFSLVDGLASKEEEFLITFDSCTQGLPHFGGSAGDDLNLNKTYVFYDGKFRSSAAIILLFNTAQKFSVFSVNHVNDSLSKLVVTDADPNTRQVFEINGEPAATVYADLLGITVDELEPEVFSLHPVAVKIGGEYYTRSIQRVNKDFYSLSFYCAVDIGIVLNEVDLIDINYPLSTKLERIRNSLGPPHLVMGCDCFLRRLEVRSKSLNEETRDIQNEFNLVGFNAYGEHINGLHLNQTFTGVYISEDTYE